MRKRKVEVIRRSARDLRTPAGLAYEMNLLLASLRRVEIRIEPQTITEFLKWKNRMQQYNGGAWPKGIEPTQQEQNYFLEAAPPNPPPDHVGTDVLICPVERSSTPGCSNVQKFEVRGLKSDARRQKQNRAGWPGFKWRRVEMRLHHHAARTGNKTPRVSLTRNVTGLSCQGKTNGDGRNMPYLVQARCQCKTSF